MIQLGWTGVDLFCIEWLFDWQPDSVSLRQNAGFFAQAFLYSPLSEHAAQLLFCTCTLFIFLVALSGTATAPLWSLLTFTQNLDMRAGETFTHS